MIRNPLIDSAMSFRRPRSGRSGIHGCRPPASGTPSRSDLPPGSQSGGAGNDRRGKPSIGFRLTRDLGQFDMIVVGGGVNGAGDMGRTSASMKNRKLPNALTFAETRL